MAGRPGGDGLEGGDAEFDLPCDTLVAVDFLVSQFPRGAKGLQGLEPFALVSQVYASVPHRTSVDRDLQVLRERHIVRLFNLPTGASDKAVMRSTDYARVIVAAREDSGAQVPKQQAATFTAKVAQSPPSSRAQPSPPSAPSNVQQHTCPCAPRARLPADGSLKASDRAADQVTCSSGSFKSTCSPSSHSSLAPHGAVPAPIPAAAAAESSRAGAARSGGSSDAAPPADTFDWFEGTVLRRVIGAELSHAELLQLLPPTWKRAADSHVTALMHAGLLTRSRGEGQSYLFAIPNIGAWSHQMVQGRKELVALLKRSRYGEMAEKGLQKKQLKSSSLGMMFHVRDLIGLGKARRIRSSAGDVIKLTR